MRAIFESRFMQVALSGGSQMTEVELNTEFERFQHEVRNLLMSDIGYLAIDFTLRDLLAQFDGIVRCKKNEHLWTLIKRAKANLRTCIAQNEKRLSFPELFTPLSPPTRSPYRWNDKFTKRDLIELATALDAIQAVVDSKGKPASFTQLIEHFSFSFNLSISSKTAYNEREYIRNVRRKSSEFISQLEQALSKKSVNFSTLTYSILQTILQGLQ